MEKTIIEVVMSKHKHMKERKMSIEVPAQKKHFKLDHIINVNKRDSRMFLPPSAVISIVTNQTGISYEDMLATDARDMDFVFNKMLVAVYLLNFTDLSLSGIASACGMKSHATIKLYISNFISYEDHNSSNKKFAEKFIQYTSEINRRLFDAMGNIKREHYAKISYGDAHTEEIIYGEALNSKSFHINSINHGERNQLHFTVPEFMAFITQANQLLLNADVQEFMLSEQYEQDLKKMESKVVKIERTFDDV